MLLILICKFVRKFVKFSNWEFFFFLIRKKLYFFLINYLLVNLLKICKYVLEKIFGFDFWKILVFFFNFILKIYYYLKYFEYCYFFDLIGLCLKWDLCLCWWRILYYVRCVFLLVGRKMEMVFLYLVCFICKKWGYYWIKCVVFVNVNIVN